MTHMWTICATRRCARIAMRDGVCTLHYIPAAPRRLTPAEVDAYVQERCPSAWAWLMGGAA